jgi:hypothetical protein
MEDTVMPHTLLPPRTYARFSAIAAITLILPGCPPTDNQDGDNGTGSTNSLHVQSYSLAAGELTSVTENLEIVSDGDVVIDGMIIAEDSTGGGYDITIRAEGDVTIHGTIQAGNAGIGTATAKPLNTRQDSRPLNDPGRDGGSVVISCKGSLTVAIDAFIRSGSGTDGANGSDGGPGGNGGDIIFCVGDRLGVYGTIDLGQGGNGGDAESSLRNAKATYENKGGDSGFICVEAGVIEWPGFDLSLWALDVNAYNASTDSTLILGGLGGLAGDVTLQPSDNDCGTVIGELSNGPSVEKIRAANGGRGWLYGGTGGAISINGVCSWKGLNGWDWEGVAGNGGDVTAPAQRTVGDCIVLAVSAIGAQAGDGGMATVTAGNGRLSGRLLTPGGRGGWAVARGGKGGSGLANHGQIGGSGGDARAHGGAGADGWPRTCDDAAGPGGDAGNGGGAEAYGGDAGSGATTGAGGTATVAKFAPASTGGTGGEGLPGGLGGTGSLLLTKDGESTANTTGDSVNLVATVTESASDGQNGAIFDPDTDCSK